MNGFVNVLKPVGATASDAVICLKRIFGQKKVGHLGTLDPGASGVLPVAVGKATCLFDYLTDKKKLYRAFFTFGKTTDTLDSYGVINGRSSALPDEKTVSAALQGFRGVLQQIPPVYSAVSVGGVRAYKLARSGVDIQLKKRSVTVYRFDMLRRVSADTYLFDIECSAGTYIRSLARDLAEAAGTVGYMSGLIRLASGCFRIEDAVTLDELRADGGVSRLLSVEYPLRDVERCDISAELYGKLLNGAFVKCPFADGLRRIYCADEFFGLGINADGKLKLKYRLGNTM